MLISKSLIFSIGVCSYIAVGVFSYYKGYSTADSEYKATLNQLQTSNLKAILNQERIYKELSKTTKIRYNFLKRSMIRFLLLVTLFLILSSLTACSTPIQAVQECPKKPSLNPILDATQKPIYSERLKKVWLSETNVTN